MKKRIISFVAVLCILSVLVVSVSAREFESRLNVFNLYANGETYGGYLNGSSYSGASGGSASGTFNIPLNLNSSFKTVFLGSTYDTVSYDYGADYKYVITFTTGATGSYTGSCPVLYGSVLSGRYIIDNSLSTVVSQKGTLEKSVSDTYTFIFENIPYDKVQGKSVFYCKFALSNFTSVDTTNLYIVSSYFGLESYFSEEKYNAEMVESLDNIQNAIESGNEKLDNIQGSLDDVGDKVDGVGDKVDEVGDQISGDINDLENAIVTQAQEEMDIADEKGNEASAEANDALSDSGLTPDLGNIWIGLMTLFDSISTTDTVSYIPIPEVKLPSLSTPAGSTPELVLIEEQNYDISPILYNDNIQKLISAAKVLYYIFFAIFIVDYCRKLLSKIGLGDVNTNDNASAKTDSSRKDPSASKSDPHGVKSR